MTSEFGELDDFFNPGIELTVRGKPYRIEPPSAEVGLWCERVAMVAGSVRSATTEAELKTAMERVAAVPPLAGEASMAERTLGATHGQLVADGVDHVRIRFLGLVAFAWIVGDEDTALAYYRSAGRPEALAPNRAARRAGTSTAAASGTRSRASGSGTTSRKPSARAKATTRSRGTAS